jgi:hypothetical protein
VARLRECRGRYQAFVYGLERFNLSMPLPEWESVNERLRARRDASSARSQGIPASRAGFKRRQRGIAAGCVDWRGKCSSPPRRLSPADDVDESVLYAADR